MSASALIVLFTLPSPSALASVDYLQQQVFTCADSSRVIEAKLPDEGTIPVTFNLEKNAIAEIEERGIPVTIKSDWMAFDVTVPLRYAKRFVELPAGNSSISIERQQLNHASGSVSIYLHCMQIDQLDVNWLRRAAKIAGRLNRPVPISDFDKIRDDIRSLDADAQTDERRALAQHLLAQALFATEQSRSAIEAFAKAEQAWIAASDPARSVVARIGWIEELVRTGQFQRAVDLIKPAGSGNEGSSQDYFWVRLQNARCVSLDNLGRLVEAKACYEWTTGRLRALDERTEYVNALRNHAILLQKLGLSDQAEKEARNVLNLASGPNAAMVRGRVHLTLADIALSRANVGVALAESNAASREFDAAGSSRWQANSLLGVARLYRELGAYHEAYASLSEAVLRLPALDAPTRLADAMTLFSDMERDGQHIDSAKWWARAAEEIYFLHNMPDQLELARIRRLELEVQQGDYGGAMSALSRRNEIPTDARVAWSLLEAEVALRRGLEPATLNTLKILQHEARSLQEQIRVAQLESEYWNLASDPAHAQRVLREYATRMEQLEDSLRSPILRYMIGRLELQLRRTAIEELLQQPRPLNSKTTIETLWHWLFRTSSQQDGRLRLDRNNTKEFDRAVAAELLAPAVEPKVGSKPETSRELLTVLAQSSEDPALAASVPRPTSLAELQEGLRQDSLFVTYVEGNTRGALLFVSHDRVDLIDTSPPDQVRASAIKLGELLRSPNWPMTEVQAAAQQLSTQLFHGMPSWPQPVRLEVFAEEPSSRVPWGVLTWPGATSPLLDATTVDFVRLQASGQTDRALLPTILKVAVAAQEGNGLSLPLLAGAKAEPTAIGRAISRSLILMQTSVGTRKAVMSALGDATAWVHIAAHGVSRPGRIGFAGIWLEQSSDDDVPPFLSWIDILDSGVRAELVVLNACQLGDSGSAIDGNLSFADAVSRAGAKHVVAALWPVSDAAAALWVPEFYSTITADPQHDAANALRAAQLRLRESRAFRHPFFWAGMQTIDRLSIGSKTLH